MEPQALFSTTVVWRVDPDCGGLGRMVWPSVREPFGAAGIGRFEILLSLFDDLPSHPAMQHFRGRQDDPAMMMLLLVPRETALAKVARVLDAAEALQELGPVLERFELALRVRIIVRNVGAIVGFGDAQIRQQQSYRLGGHRGTAVGVDSQIAGHDVLFGACIGDQALGQFGGFAGRHHPAHHVLAEDVQDDVEVEVGPPGRSQQLRYIP